MYEKTSKGHRTHLPCSSGDRWLCYLPGGHYRLRIWHDREDVCRISVQRRQHVFSPAAADTAFYRYACGCGRYLRPTGKVDRQIKDRIG